MYGCALEERGNMGTAPWNPAILTFLKCYEILEMAPKFKIGDIFLTQNI